MRVVRAPLRVSLCGGGTDLPSFYNKEGWGAVCSLAINKYVYVVTKPLSDLFPFRFKIGYSQTELCNSVDNIQHPIVRSVLQRRNVSNLDMASFADIPAGTGLGSSSAFTVALLEATQRDALFQSDIARQACEIEIDQLKEPIGKQDQYASALGGINYLVFRSDGNVQINSIEDNYQDESFQLFYLGGSRSASGILKTQSDEPNFESLGVMRLYAISCADAMRTLDMQAVGALVTEGWELKKTLAPGITTPEIDSYIQIAKGAGAWGAKLLGAGGTGFILVVAPKTKQLKISRELGLKQIEFKLDQDGVCSL